ncbi:MAG: hypothetical protein FJ039_12075 [Chloroflexi bacterium]|nr:hypothetical protein [Chloroflexota bacterium]
MRLLLRTSAKLWAVLFACVLAVTACGEATGPRRDGRQPLAPSDTWARQRVEAILQFYSFSEAGAQVVRDLDVRHMIGRPGWFGSYGANGYFGIGSARPTAIVHEISHTLWGHAPVVGKPELSWTAKEGERLAPAYVAFRKDLETFLQQQPDGFEPLRARLRQIPDLISGSGYPGLYHLGEAELVSYTGGNLNLIPPILRKYYSPYLTEGGFASWDEAARWYLSLPGDERRLADVYIGVGHMPLGGFAVEEEPKAKLPEAPAKLAEREERRRLADFAQQYALYFKDMDGHGPVVRDFRFWRGYVQDLMHTHGRYPDTLRAMPGRGRRIGAQFDFLLALERAPQGRRAAMARERILRDAFFREFAPAIGNRVLLALLAAEATPSERRAARLTEAALDPFHLRVLREARSYQALLQKEPKAASERFEAYVRSLTRDERGAMNFILSILGELDRDATRTLLRGLSPEAMRTVYSEGPAFTRFVMEPEELVAGLGYGGELSAERLTELAKLFNDKVTANPEVDGRFLEVVYRRVLRLGERDPQAAWRLFTQTGLLIEPLLLRDPQGAASLITRAPRPAAEAIRSANPVRLPPARAVYVLAQSQPQAAARLVLEYEAMGAREAVLDALAYFAYLGPRKQAQPRLGVSLENHGRFLDELLSRRGESWLRTAFQQMAQGYQARIANDDIPRDFFDAFQDTLAATYEAYRTSDLYEFITHALIVTCGPNSQQRA